MELPIGGTYSKDDFYSGTCAALAGGTTMIVDFAQQEVIVFYLLKTSKNQSILNLKISKSQKTKHSLTATSTERN